MSCSSLIEMKRSRIEFGSRAPDARRIEVEAPGPEGLPRLNKIFQGSLGGVVGGVFLASASKASAVHGSAG